MCVSTHVREHACAAPTRAWQGRWLFTALAVISAWAVLAVRAGPGRQSRVATTLAAACLPLTDASLPCCRRSPKSFYPGSLCQSLIGLRSAF